MPLIKAPLQISGRPKDEGHDRPFEPVKDRPLDPLREHSKDVFSNLVKEPTVGVPVPAAPTLPGSPALDEVDAHGGQSPAHAHLLPEDPPVPEVERVAAVAKEAGVPVLGQVPKLAPPSADPYLERAQAQALAGAIPDRVELLQPRRVTVIEAPPGTPRYWAAMAAAGLDPELKDTVREVYLPRLIASMQRNSTKEAHAFLPSECWLWTGATDEFGWPVAKIFNRHVKPARTWLALQSIPASLELERGRFVITACKRRNCVQPNHWMEATAKEAIDWLDDVGLGQKVLRIRAPKAPMPKELEQAMAALREAHGDGDERGLAIAMLKDGRMKNADIARATGYTTGRISQLKKAIKEGTIK